MMMQKRTNTGSCFNMKVPIFVQYTMLDIAQLCKTNCHSRNYFRLIKQHGTLKVQIYMNLNFIWLIFNANVNCNAFEVEHEKLEHNNQ